MFTVAVQSFLGFAGSLNTLFSRPMLRRLNAGCMKIGPIFTFAVSAGSTTGPVGGGGSDWARSAAGDARSAATSTAARAQVRCVLIINWISIETASLRQSHG